MSRETASQTAGPYLHIGLLPGATLPGGNIGHTTPGPGRRTLTGRILDGAGDAVPDAMIELWRADHHAPVWVRAGCDGDGRFTFHVPPPQASDGQAPHVTLWIVARGIGLALQTRAYFDGDPRNATDPVLSRVPAHRRKTLMARRIDDIWNMNIVLQGADETVFLDL